MLNDYMIENSKKIQSQILKSQLKADLDKQVKEKELLNKKQRWLADSREFATSKKLLRSISPQGHADCDGPSFK